MQLLAIYILSTLSFILGKVDSFLIPCPFKYLTNLDCPGCGFQRSALALVQGNFQQSFHLYAPTIPFLLCFLVSFLSYVFKWDKNSKLLKIMYLATGIIVTINYVYKIATHQLH